MTTNAANAPAPNAAPNASAAPASGDNNQPNVQTQQQTQAPAPAGQENVNIELDVTKETVKENVSEPLFERGEDPALNLAFEFIENQGFKPGDPAVEAAFEGNFELLKAELEKKGVKNYETYLKIAEKAYQQELENHKATITKIKSAVIEVVGDEKTWEDVRSFVRANADESERAEINALLNQSEFTARAVTTYLLSIYKNAPGVNVQPASVSEGRSAASSPSGTYALSKAEYTNLVQDLVNRVGPHKAESTAEYRELVKRREAGRRSGL